MLTTSTSRGKKQVPEWFKDRISTHSAAGLLSTFSCFYSFSSCSKRRTSLCVCVSVCVSFQNSHVKSKAAMLKTLAEIFRSSQSIISLLPSPPSKRHHFVGKICLCNLIFLVSLFFLPFAFQPNTEGGRQSRIWGTPLQSWKTFIQPLAVLRMSHLMLEKWLRVPHISVS